MMNHLRQLEQVIQCKKLIDSNLLFWALSVISGWFEGCQNIES